MTQRLVATVSGRVQGVDTPGYVDSVEVDWQAPEGLDRFVTR